MLKNTGEISGPTAISSSEAGLTLDNGGTITGTSYAVNLTGSGTTISNSGKIDGAVKITSGGDSFRNTGAIDGNVTFQGSGDNSFNSRGGTVDGAITGGSGADTIYLGNDGETVNGGAGHDLIYGGAGADTFAFTSFTVADYDHVVGFNVANDKIQLDHTEFTKLTAGVTPVFAIASSATSASDHLFYNSTTGWVSYDPDGNGSQVAHGFVNLGAGLKLTAHNFTVV
jgi:Ca2+-binding RTX toxin-like protein